MPTSQSSNNQMTQTSSKGSAQSQPTTTTNQSSRAVNHILAAALVEVMSDVDQGRNFINKCLTMLLKTATSQLHDVATVKKDSSSISKIPPHLKLDEGFETWLNGVAIAACAISFGDPVPLTMDSIAELAVNAGVSTKPNAALSVAIILRAHPLNVAPILQLKKPTSPAMG